MHVLVNAIIEEAEARKSTKTIFLNGYTRNAFLHYSAMRNRFGKTPLFEAVKNGHMEVAQLLVQHELVTSYDPLNAMRIAIKRGNEDMVRFLIGESKQAHVNIETLGLYSAPYEDTFSLQLTSHNRHQSSAYPLGRPVRQGIHAGPPRQERGQCKCHRCYKYASCLSRSR